MILSRAIGIDLGTTNSAVGILHPNDQDIILWRDDQNRSTLPSCVWQDPKNGDLVVGHRAYARKGTLPEPISSIKRSMGTQTMVSLGGKEYAPAEISAFILGKLVAEMGNYLQKTGQAGIRYDISRAIVTVPAYFGLPAIEATREAGRIAGLELMELLAEPTAAAIYYSWKYNLGDGVYLVYDLGGGTFDVSILRRTKGEFLVLGISGDNFLGGDDFDRRLAEYLRTLLVNDSYKLDLDVNGNPGDKLRFNQLMTLAERVKIALSEQTEVHFTDQGTLRDQENTPIMVDVTIDRATFEGLLFDLLEKTISCCHDALKFAHEKSSITLSDVDHILLVGGSTYVPIVTDMVRSALCRNGRKGKGEFAKAEKPIRDEPETAVALGAALRAASHGIGIGDDEKKVRIWFKGAGSTNREETTIIGQVEPLNPEVQVLHGLLRLKTDDGNLLSEVPLSDQLRFRIEGVPLQKEAINNFHIELVDSKDQVVVALDRSIAHGAQQKETIGNTLSPAVLSKPILLEGTDGERLVRQVLLPEGTSLPCSFRFTFAMNNPQGHVRIPIYQGNRMIKELLAEVGTIPLGMPVDVEIKCDDQVRIKVRFSIGDRQFGGDIEPPPPDTVPTESGIEDIRQQFGEALEALDEQDRERYITASEHIFRELDDARSGGDYAKVIQRTADLSGLVRDVRLVAPLRPPLVQVHNSYQGCMDLWENAIKIKPGLKDSSFLGDLANALEHANEAYEKRDHQVYADAVHIIATANQFLSSLASIQVSGNQEVDEAVQAVLALDQLRQMTQYLFFNSLKDRRVDYLKTAGQILGEVEQLEASVSTHPVDVLHRCQVLMVDARRILQEMNPQKSGFEDLLRVSGDIKGFELGDTSGMIKS